MGILIPEMSLSDIYSGFGGSSIIMVAGMCIVGDALFQTGVAQKIGAKIAQTPLINNERVFIVDNNNGERLDTYVIAGERGSGVVCLNGAAARKVQPGDIVIIMAYAMVTPEEARDFKPSVIFPEAGTNKLI